MRTRGEKERVRKGHRRGGWRERDRASARERGKVREGKREREREAPSCAVGSV